MNILVYSTDDFLPPAGGAETALWEVARRLPHHRFTLLCARLDRRRPRHQTVGNITIHRTGIGIPKPDGILLGLLGARYARRLHAREPFDLVWSVMASYGAFAATRFARRAHVPHLLTLQEGKELNGIVRLTPPFRGIFRHAGGLHAISRYLLNWGVRMGFRPGLPAKVIPNGVDIGQFARRIPAADIAANRASLGISPGSYVIVTTSRLVPKNGIGHLIAALSLLPERFKLVIHGYGPLEKSLKRQAALLSATGRIRFAGHLERSGLPLALQSADLFVRPSLSEGLGTSFLEAMASRIPVVGTPVGGIVDFIRDGETGFLAKPGNPKDLARVIAHAAALDIAAREALCARASALIAQSYDWDKIAADMDSFFTELCKRT